MFKALPRVSLPKQIIYDNLVMIIAIGLVNVFTYVYQLAMGILLKPEDYGALLSLVSIFVIISVITQTITNTITLKTVVLKAEGEDGSIGKFYRVSLKTSVIAGISLFVLLALLSPILSKYLQINNAIIVILLFSSMLFSFPLANNWGILQGLQKFGALGANQTLAALLKTLLALLLVTLGFGLRGAVIAWSLSLLIPLSLTVFSLKSLPYKNKANITYGELGNYAALTLMAIAAITIMTNIDVVIAKHYLNAADGGNYAAIAVLGRIALYAPAGIGIVLFPKVVQANIQNIHNRKVYMFSLGMTLAIVAVICLVYGLFPNAVVHFVFGTKYSLAAVYLFKYGVAMSLFAITYLGVTYALSRKETKIAYVVMLVMVSQISLFIIFHRNISEFVNNMLLTSIFSLIGTFIAILVFTNVFGKTKSVAQEN